MTTKGLASTGKIPLDISQKQPTRVDEDIRAEVG